MTVEPSEFCMVCGGRNPIEVGRGVKRYPDGTEEVVSYTMICKPCNRRMHRNAWKQMPFAMLVASIQVRIIMITAYIKNWLNN